MEKIIVMIFDEDKVPKDADWTSAVKLNADLHNEVYEALCEFQDKQQE
jgi:hypothetical protein